MKYILYSNNSYLDTWTGIYGVQYIQYTDVTYIHLVLVIAVTLLLILKNENLKMEVELTWASNKAKALLAPHKWNLHATQLTIRKRGGSWKHFKFTSHVQLKGWRETEQKWKGAV